MKFPSTFKPHIKENDIREKIKQREKEEEMTTNEGRRRIEFEKRKNIYICQQLPEIRVVVYAMCSVEEGKFSFSG